MKRPMDDAEIKAAANAAASGASVSDNKAGHLAQDSATVGSPGLKRNLRGAALVQRWTELGLIGYRADITDAEAHSRRLRDAAQRRTIR
jgi:hypothetical protein